MISCGHCKEKHETAAEVLACSQKGKGSYLSMPQQKYLGDLMAQLGLLPDGDWAINTISYAEGQAILSALIDARRSKATGHPYSFPKGVKIDPHPPTPKERRPTMHMNIRDIPKVPEGHYAIPSRTGNNDYKFYRVDWPEGTGRVYVKIIIGGHPEYNVRGFRNMIKVLKAIEDFGVEKAGWTYGQELEQCQRCNRHLTEYASRKMSMGPDCAKQRGLGAKWRKIQASRSKSED